MWISPFTPKILEVQRKGPVTTNTGLVFPNGDPIYKTIMPEPIGFLHFKSRNDDDDDSVS